MHGRAGARRALSALLAAGLLVAGLAGLAGCRRGTYVWVKPEGYSPQLAPFVPVYKGREVFLSSFTNAAADTSTWYYYSKDRGVTYEGSPSLHGYLWRCFAKAFESLGATVHDAAPEREGPAPPELRLTFSSWTDEELRFQVTLVSPGLPAFEKDYTVLWERGPATDPAQLEQQAYRMVDAAVTSVLADPAFQAPFLGRASI